MVNSRLRRFLFVPCVTRWTSFYRALDQIWGLGSGINTLLDDLNLPMIIADDLAFLEQYTSISRIWYINIIVWAGYNSCSQFSLLSVFSFWLIYCFSTNVWDFEISVHSINILEQWFSNGGPKTLSGPRTYSRVPRSPASSVKSGNRGVFSQIVKKGSNFSGEFSHVYVKKRSLLPTSPCLYPFIKLLS